MKTKSLPLLITACLSLSAFDQPDEGVMDVYDNFSLSNSAASRCVLPNGSVLKNFIPNYQLVTKGAALYLKQMTPTLSDDAIGQILKRRYTGIDQKVAETIAQEGCDGFNLRQILKQFENLAAMDPTSRTQKRTRPPQ